MADVADTQKLQELIAKGKRMYKEAQVLLDKIRAANMRKQIAKQKTQ